MATIYDVARLAGVSPATVSRVFNGASVSPEKIEAVRAAAREL
ncbi:LacI family DNA-binding transcriptional regulator, partial [Microbacterium sp.]